METLQVRRSEDAAHRVTVTGWACKHCSHYWGDDERMARYCCSTEHKCETESCDARADKHNRFCDECSVTLRREEHMKLSAKPYTGEVVCTPWGDDYFFSKGDVLEWLAKHECPERAMLLMA